MNKCIDIGQGIVSPISMDTVVTDRLSFKTLMEKTVLNFKYENLFKGLLFIRFSLVSISLSSTHLFEYKHNLRVKCNS